MANSSQKIRIKLKSYDSRLLEHSTQSIVKVAKSSGAFVSGPIPLPTKKELYTVNRSPHGDKKSMEQFGLHTHTRLVDIKQPTADTLDGLKRLSLPAGVEITVAA